MKTDGANADRMQAVRRAAADWHRTGWIDDLTRQKVEESYPDDRVRAGLVFRFLFFVLTMCALQGALGVLYSLSGSGSRIGVFALCTGLACVWLTEYLLGPLKRREGGIEAAVSMIALVQLMIAVGVLCEFPGTGFETRLAIDLPLFAVLALAAAWRWGYWPYAAAAALLFFLGSSLLPWGRLVWILVPLALFRWLLAGCDTARLPPALRKCSAAFLAICILAFYAAVNVYSLDHKSVESALWTSHPYREILPRWLSIILTAVVPAGVFVLGIRTRRRLLSSLGLVLGVASLITLRYYAHLAPLWLALCSGGAALLGSSELLSRYLSSGIGKERGGYTAEPLLENPKNQRALEMLVSVAALTPRAQPAADKPGFQGGGGKFGGGGASGEF